jgi:hypothetical protein
MAAKLSPALANNNTLTTEPKKEFPQKMGPVEAKIAAARSNKAALDEVADFDDARIDSAEFEDDIDYNDAAFIESFAQGTSENEGIEDGAGAGFYVDEGLDQPVNKGKRPNNSKKQPLEQKKWNALKLQ